MITRINNKYRISLPASCIALLSQLVHKEMQVTKTEELILCYKTLSKILINIDTGSSPDYIPVAAADRKHITSKNVYEKMGISEEEQQEMLNTLNETLMNSFQSSDNSTKEN